MESGGESTPTLEYALRRSIRDATVVKWWCALPHWLIALALLTPFFVYYHWSLNELVGWPERGKFELFTFACVLVLFMTGAARRLNWRHALLALGLAFCWRVIDRKYLWRFEAPFPYQIVVALAAPTFLAGIGEWMTHRTRVSRSLFWLFIFSLVVGCLVPLVQKPLDYTGVVVRIPGPHRGQTSLTTWGGLVYWPLWIVLAWVAIPLALRLGRATGRREPLLAGLVATASLVLFLSFFHMVVYRVARRSLVVGRPFARDYAASVLDQRRSASDVQALWQTLDCADWSAPENRKELGFDYRRTCISVLERNDAPSTAVRLSTMLREKPSKTLAEMSAHLLAAQQRYETAPLLMRYALLGSSDCTKALEEMRIPDAAGLIIMLSMIYDRPLDRTYRRPIDPDENFPVSSEYRSRLVQLLGSDAGPMLQDWERFYFPSTARFPTPLSGEVAAEEERIPLIIGDYWKAKNRLQAQGISDAAVAPPDWNVVGTDALAVEVQRYSARVNAAVGGATTREARP